MLNRLSVRVQGLLLGNHGCRFTSLQVFVTPEGHMLLTILL
jgi:hypothetical protein